MRTRKPAQERRREIVDAALRLVAQVGPERLTTRDIAAAVGISEAALFRHFATKDGLWAAVIGRLEERSVARWARILAEPAPPLDQLRGLLTAQLALVASEPGVPVILFSGELHRRSPALRAALLALMLRFQHTLETVVGEAQRAGTLRADRPAAVIALATIALLQGLVLRWSLTGHASALLEEAGPAVELLLHGLRIDRC